MKTSKKGVLLTVVTPTYNRGDVLNKCYESLCAQTDSRLVWLIVDDGSTDNTYDIVSRWKSENKISIEYYKQENAGKPQALNKAISVCNTKLFFCVDSDDFLSSDAVESIYTAWKEAESHNCIGIVCPRFPTEIKGYEKQKIEFNMDVHMCTFSNLYNKYKFTGETGLIYKTDIIKKYPFPKFYNEKFIPEYCLYIQADNDGLLFLLNNPIYKYAYLEDGYTRNNSNLIRNNPNGYIWNAHVVINNSKYFSERLKFAAKYWIGSWLAGKKRIYKSLDNKSLMLLALPIGIIAYIKKYKL
ncbi:glycosyltransferase family 2 protein [Clostridium estertheticum]|uniref:glycosyltransferase family 2 protein n=1 Tax=Clostridium estertheticum TaxID=238834 RepID=UPI001CF1B536|nr:glycosyltransferase family 2 protein [Clostridium estertheticum]MCB2339589.1 glycosyltransferase family 2 protein [Clostridium estertheticum]